MKSKAYAKINLFLKVLDERDDGMHNLEMVNITVGLADEIEFNLTENGKIEVTTSIPKLNGSDNLSYKVADYMKKVYRVKDGVQIYIEKKIPVGGGLAGGSSDAAETIRCLNELWKLNLSFDQMIEIAKKFGSDIPYCLYRVPAIVRGIGDIIEPIDLNIENYEISLFSPRVNVLTGYVFKNLHNINSKTGSLDENLKKLMSKDYSVFKEGLRNDLEETVFSLYPEVKQEYDLLSRVYGKDGLFMTGSGSTIVKISEKK